MHDVFVSRLTHEAQGVLGIELRAADGGALPTFTAGAHVDVHLPGGLCRQYSLTNGPAQADRYCLGVGLAPDSRGGSREVHERLRAGDRLQVSAPRPLFGLALEAPEHVFVAGGIGITPILSMIEACQATGQHWRLLYCVRSRARAAYLWRLAAHYPRVQVHVDEEQEALADVAGFLQSIPHMAHVYCCGPAPLMDAVGREAASAGLPPHAVHFERFAADGAAADAAADRAFRVTLRRQGASYLVPAGRSILETLEENGIALPCACREGLCRTCETPLLAGRADHRDFVLTEQERAANTSIIPCVSRALDDELVLDL
ncbi:PDR/VanB family oxidoreductase [Variovorax fucosicus]|uniref:PDR/VanB family oxidoreductase n=1 Tax=Variovorax fucosicus TaxID=3053517 RepID=UPI0025784007|nr:PDR/VanB family oxidoreductase [Variovorax sp. J22G47]MDM0059154.1 PDR/VanB family oxidoreductase [Variovorax sp. J22G47]